ncbi:hypothetical protein CJ739_3148 [Mariniflexile rhizosphaerae]|nr:hypothetical protein CJ739_3148 [Mariniflexile sp. TRM1-10]PLB19225.1 MAG: hypothetical protein TRG1_1929 [Flavobacteriaceae bacterium FS1-H7996/R]
MPTMVTVAQLLIPNKSINFDTTKKYKSLKTSDLLFTEL